MKPNDSTEQIRRGMLLSYLNFAAGALIPLFYTPRMLRLLGQTEYGLYKLAVSTAGYLSLTNFGIGSAASHFLIRAQVRGGAREQARMLALFRVLLDLAALAAMLGGVLLAWKLELLYGASLTARELRRVRVLLVLLAADTAVGFSAAANTALVFAQERFVFARTVDVLATVLLPCADLAALYLGLRAVGLAAISLCFGILSKIAYAFYVKKRMKMRPIYRSLPTDALRDIFRYCVWVFLGGLVAQIYGATDTVILGATPSLAANAAAVYSVGAAFSDMLFRVSQIAPAFFSPQLSRMVFRRADAREVDAMVIRIGRIQAFAVLPICSGFAAFGRPFLALYAGEAYAQAYAVALILMLPNCIALLQSGAYSVLYARGLHRFRALVYLGIAVCNIVLTIPMARRWGIVGAALPTGAAYLLGQGVIMNIYYRRRVGLDIPLFWKKVLPAFLPAALLCGAACAISRVVDFTVPVYLAGGIALYSLLWCAALWFFIMEDEEKRAVRTFLRRRACRAAESEEIV